MLSNVRIHHACFAPDRTVRAYSALQTPYSRAASRQKGNRGEGRTRGRGKRGREWKGGNGEGMEKGEVGGIDAPGSVINAMLVQRHSANNKIV